VDGVSFQAESLTHGIARSWIYAFFVDIHSQVTLEYRSHQRAGSPRAAIGFVLRLFVFAASLEVWDTVHRRIARRMRVGVV
jgi:hypothetical protein